MDFISQNFPMLAGAGAAITMGWSYLKTIFFQIRNLIIHTVEFDEEVDYFLHYAIKTYCKRSVSPLNSASAFYRYHRKVGYGRLSLYNNKTLTIGLTNSNFPVICSKKSITFIRGTFDIKHFANHLSTLSDSFYSNKIENRSNVHDVYGKINDKISIGKEGEVPTLMNKSSLGAYDHIRDYLVKNIPINESVDVKLNTSLYSKDVLEKVNMLKHWVKSRDWFIERGIPWSRSIRVEGKPGSGKSTFIRNLAYELNLPIFKFHLSTMDNRDFTEEWKNVTRSSPAIILLEDFDRLFNDKQEFLLEKLTLDCVLNCISGANDYSGVLTIITANFPERLDPAMGQIIDGKSTRPGRLDFLIEINELSEQARYSIANKILDTFPEEIDNVVKLGEGETASQFSQRCIELANTKFWENLQ